MTGLWLIGIWQRSPISSKIKHLCGNKSALSSAYSILDYRPAEELGGTKALARLEKKLANHHMLLACDMVSNHTGMDASWIFDHPDRYIFTKESPNKDFTFNTPNLSDNPAGDIYLERGYYDQSGAAEVFKFVSRKDGEVRYVYHGNDGTSMPWNDTAQLNYLNQDTRKAALDEIVRVAQQFPIIRLDAAMTLTCKHFQRLWYPSSTEDQCVPTREAFGMSKEEFDRQMPHEFWAEVIHELSLKAPQTLLIAEAFWLTEHFFINEIGMHRVYNSGFMHWLRDEKNADYRNYLKKILTDDPSMLERFANFLTTPDERPASVQFGKSSKYFGACRLLACLPGLPMFGMANGKGSKSNMHGYPPSHHSGKTGNYPSLRA
jgi:glycosidase